MARQNGGMVCLWSSADERDGCGAAHGLRVHAHTHHVQLQVHWAINCGQPDQNVEEEGDADVEGGAPAQRPQLGQGLPVRRWAGGL